MNNNQKLYNGLVELGNISADQVPSEAMEILSNLYELSGDEQAKRGAVALMAKAANTMSEEEFVKALFNDEFPVIASQDLSEDEMDNLKGGRGKRGGREGLGRSKERADRKTHRRGCW